MYLAETNIQFSSVQPLNRWLDSPAVQRAQARKNLLLASFLTACIAVLDLLTPHMNFSVMYVAPLILFSQTPYYRSGWKFAGLLVLLTFGIHIVKNGFLFAPLVDLPF